MIAIFTTPTLQFYVQNSSTEVNSFAAALFYLVYIVVIAGAILLLMKYYRKPGLFTLMEGAVVLLATGFVFFAIFNTVFPNVNTTYLLVAAAAITMVLIIAKNARPKLRNLIAITSSIGVGILIGFNGFYLAYFLMLLIAIYDYVAVFVTKHMVSMAKEMSSRNLAFLIGSTDVEAVPQKYMSKGDISEFKKREGKSKDPLVKELVKSGVYPIISQVQLGTGDLALPLMLAVAAYISFLSYFAAMMIVLGAASGMIFTMYLLKKYKVALPAIPPLFAFINLFLAALFAINDVEQYGLWLEFLTIFIVTILLLLNKLNSLKNNQ